MDQAQYQGQGSVGFNGGQQDGPKGASSETAPQNYYRTYGTNGKPFTGTTAIKEQSFVEVRSNLENIKIANGGVPGFGVMGTTGDFVGDGQ